MRRALAFGARVRGLDHCAMCNGFGGQWALLDCTSTCDARVWLAPRIGWRLPPIQCIVYPLDASQMSIILTGIYSWNVISERYTV